MSHPNADTTDKQERTLNPETHYGTDYMDLLQGTDSVIHFYLKDDKEWYVAHSPENVPDGELDGPWLFWSHYPSGGWELDFFTDEFAEFHLDELWYGPVRDRKHSIHRVRQLSYKQAPEFVRAVVV